MSTQGPVYRVTKRGIDIAAAAVGLAITTPVQLVVALLIARSMGRPVIFRQRRPGLNGKPFTLLKFRTMQAPAAGRIADADRITTLGRALRSSSLDELPTLWNVLRGDMSLVGPRPLLMHYLDRYTPEQARRHEVRPGITGLAQVSGRNLLSWDEKFAADVTYVEQRCLSLDLQIMIRTIAAVISGRGISAPDDATMPEFLGASRQ